MTSRKTVLAFVLALSVFAAIGLTLGELGPVHRNPTKEAALLASAIVGVGAWFGGSRMCNIYLVALGSLMLIDAFRGLTRGLFYLDFSALYQEAVPLAAGERFLASVPSIVFGVLALGAGLHFINADARAHNSAPPQN